MRYRNDKPDGWQWPVVLDRTGPTPSPPCEECGGTDGVHRIDCPVLLHDAELLKDTEWGQGILALNRVMNGEDINVVLAEIADSEVGQ